jgi:hypothetical protein
MHSWTHSPRAEELLHRDHFLRRFGDNWQVFLFQQKRGHWDVQGCIYPYQRPDVVQLRSELIIKDEEGGMRRREERVLQNDSSMEYDAGTKEPIDRGSDQVIISG